VQVTNLMHMYKGLEDPDALTGVVSLRQGGPSTSDWILAAQKIGRWNEADSLFEVSLPTPVDTAPTTEITTVPGAAAALRDVSAGPMDDYLASFLAAGKPRLLLSVAEGWVRSAQGAAASAHAAAAGVAAAWRLADWPSADHFLKARVLCTPGWPLPCCHAQGTDGSGLGRCLMHMYVLCA
jgi:hypothetical protein